MCLPHQRFQHKNIFYAFAKGVFSCCLYVYTVIKKTDWIDCVRRSSHFYGVLFIYKYLAARIHRSCILVIVYRECLVCVNYMWGKNRAQIQRKNTQHNIGLPLAPRNVESRNISARRCCRLDGNPLRNASLNELMMMARKELLLHARQLIVSSGEPHSLIMSWLWGCIPRTAKHTTKHYIGMVFYYSLYTISHTLYSTNAYTMRHTPATFHFLTTKFAAQQNMYLYTQNHTNKFNYFALII